MTMYYIESLVKHCTRCTGCLKIKPQSDRTETKSLAIANRSCISCTHNVSRASI